MNGTWLLFIYCYGFLIRIFCFLAEFQALCGSGIGFTVDGTGNVIIHVLLLLIPIFNGHYSNLDFSKQHRFSSHLSPPKSISPVALREATSDSYKNQNSITIPL